MGYIGLGVIYGLVGIIIGSVSSIFFFRMDVTWKKIITIGSSGGSYFGSITVLNKFFEINDVNLKIFLFMIFLIGFAGGILVTFYKLCTLLKNQDGSNVIRVIDIFLGHKSFIDNYYNTRKDEIDNSLNYEKLVLLKDSVETQKRKLENREILINELEEKYKEQIKDGISIALPVGQYIPVTKQFINLFPDYIESYSRFVSNINGYTVDFEKKVKSKEYDVKVLLHSYFLAVCTFAITDLFGVNCSNKIRAHFRFLNNDNAYISLVATYGAAIYDRALTPIPINVGLISRSSQIQRSIIRSLNLDCDFETANHGVYEDYITMTFGNIKKDNVPFLTMGIAVKNKERYKNMMYFLNFCKIENIIQESIDRIGQMCNIIDIINSENENSKEMGA